MLIFNTFAFTFVFYIFYLHSILLLPKSSPIPLVMKYYLIFNTFTSCICILCFIFYFVLCILHLIVFCECYYTGFYKYNSDVHSSYKSIVNATQNRNWTQSHEKWNSQFLKLLEPRLYWNDWNDDNYTTSDILTW